LRNFGNRGDAASKPSSGTGAFSNSLGLVGRTLADVERDLIIETLAHCLGNRTRAATVLGISIRTLRNKLKEYARAGIVVPRHGRSGAHANDNRASNHDGAV
jgi:two-component system, response regulator FlrC